MLFTRICSTFCSVTFIINEKTRLVLTTLPNGTQIRLSDIADVVETSADVNTLARVDGEEAVLINVFKQENANAIDLSDAVAEAVVQLENRYSDEGLQIRTVSDTSDFTRESIKSVLMDLLIAVLLVTFVILIFLHNWRNALIVMLVVPLSLIGSFIGMDLFNFTLNIMSLLGLSVVIGVLVDDAIVVIENVCRHMEMGKNALQATKDAMNEIGFTVISITIVLVIVFLPIALTNSLVSDILRQFCGVIIFSILFSLLVSLTLVPLLTSRFGKMDVLNPDTVWGKMMGWFEKQIGSFGDDDGEFSCRQGRFCGRGGDFTACGSTGACGSTHGRQLAGNAVPATWRGRFPHLFYNVFYIAHPIYDFLFQYVR